MDMATFQYLVLNLFLLALLFLIRKNTRLNLILLAFLIPFESYIYWDASFTLKPVHLFAFTTFVSMVLNRGKVVAPTKEFIPFLLILSAALVSLTNAPSELIFRSFQGSMRMIFNLVGLYFIAYTLSFAIKDGQILKEVMISYAGGVSLSVLIELMRAYMGGWGHNPVLFSWLPSGYLRLTPSNIAPNHYAAFLLLAICFITLLGINSQIKKGTFTRLFFPVSFILCLYAFILTFSRSPWFSYIVATVLILFNSKKEDIRKAVIHGFAYLAIVAVLLLKIYPGSLEPVFERAALLPVYRVFFNEAGGVGVDPSAAERMLRWRHSFELFKSHPVAGYGWASDLTAHNLLLQVLAESGLIGLGAFTVFTSVLFLKLFESVRLLRGEMRVLAVGISAVLLSYSIYLMTDIGLYQVQTWFLVGLAMSIGRMATAEKLLRSVTASQPPV